MNSMILSLLLSCIIIIPVAVKWKLEKNIVLAAVISIGLISWGFISTFSDLYTASLTYGLLLHTFVTAALSMCLLLWRFFRDPDRIPPKDPNIIISPADGRIIYIREVAEDKVPFSEKKGKKYLLNEFVQSNVLPSKGLIIGIAMNYLDVHVNRSPISGKISFIKHIKGLFLSLKDREAIIRNERVLTVIENGTFKVGVVQIASRLVRKIVPYLSQGDAVVSGQKIGAIRFGSQVDLIIPCLPRLNLKVTPGDKVNAGVTVLASYNTTK